MYDRPRLYLRLGDKVVHLRYEEWGQGAVVEEMTSMLVGGTCLVRILFEDGQQRTFNNDLDSDICCISVSAASHIPCLVENANDETSCPTAAAARRETDRNAPLIPSPEPSPTKVYQIYRVTSCST